jgi:Tol biopolymer transport system component
MNSKPPLAFALSSCLAIPFVLVWPIAVSKGPASRFLMTSRLRTRQHSSLDTTREHAPQAYENGRVVGSERVDGEGSSQIFSFAPDGSDRRQLTTSGSNIIPSWSRDGKRILFTSNNEIFVMNGDGSGKRQLTFHTQGANITPVESPDGKHIAFTGIRGDNRPEVWVMNADGSGQKQLTTTPRVLPKATANPLSGQTLFDRLPPKMKKLEKELPGWLQNVDHKDQAAGAMSLLHTMQEHIKSNHFEEAEPELDALLKMMGFSPDGVVRTAPTIYEMSSSMHPTWSADGKRLAFASTRYGTTQVWMMNSDGSGQRQLTHGLGDRFPDANVPCWSMDGKLITFWAGYERRYGEVWVMDPDGTNPRRVTHTQPPANSDDPRWAPDRTKIIYGSGSPAGRDMYVVDVKSGATRLFAKNIEWCDWQAAPRTSH